MAAELEHNRLSISLDIDTNVIPAEWQQQPEVLELFDLHRAGWIELTKSDVVETELIDAPANKKNHLLGKIRTLFESFGPAVTGHSRPDTSVVSSEEDANRIEQVFKILFPGSEMPTTRRQNVRDTMHIATAIRYGKEGFVTNDKRLLRASDEIANAFKGFRIWSPEEALQVIERRRETRERRLRLED